MLPEAAGVGRRPRMWQWGWDRAPKAAWEVQGFTSVSKKEGSWAVQAQPGPEGPPPTRSKERLSPGPACFPGTAGTWGWRHPSTEASAPISTPGLHCFEHTPLPPGPRDHQCWAQGQGSFSWNPGWGGRNTGIWRTRAVPGGLAPAPHGVLWPTGPFSSGSQSSGRLCPECWVHVWVTSRPTHNLPLHSTCH